MLHDAVTQNGLILPFCSISGYYVYRIMGNLPHHGSFTASWEGAAVFYRLPLNIVNELMMQKTGRGSFTAQTRLRQGR